MYNNLVPSDAAEANRLARAIESIQQELTASTLNSSFKRFVGVALETAACSCRFEAERLLG